MCVCVCVFSCISLSELFFTCSHGGAKWSCLVAGRQPWFMWLGFHNSSAGLQNQRVCKSVRLWAAWVGYIVRTAIWWGSLYPLFVPFKKPVKKAETIFYCLYYETIAWIDTREKWEMGKRTWSRIKDLLILLPLHEYPRAIWENLFRKTAKVVKKRYFYYLGRGVSKILP